MMDVTVYYIKKNGVDGQVGKFKATHLFIRPDYVEMYTDDKEVEYIYTNRKVNPNFVEIDVKI